MDDDIIDCHCDPKEPRAISFEQITTADLLLADGVTQTPCTSAVNRHAYNMDLYLKKEFMHPTGSFKERGARLALLLLSQKQKEIGVISASTGNHAMAISYHGNQLNIPITVVMPTCASASSIEKCRSYNATVIVEGRDIFESRIVALVLAKEHELEYINGYDHPDVIAGCGTIGFEILKQIPKINAVVVPIGGGGLIAGIATTIKTISPATKIIGVESEKCPSFTLALQKGSSIYTPPNSSLAESLLVPVVGCNALAMSAALIDKVVVVREVWVALAMLRLAEEEGCVVEGAGAVGFAAILAGQLKEFEMKRVVVLLTGCNTSVTVFGRALERGLAAERRLLQSECNCSNHERRVHDLFEKISPLGLNIDELLAECVWLMRVYKWEEEYCYMSNTSNMLSLAKLRKREEKNIQDEIKQATLEDTLKAQTSTKKPEDEKSRDKREMPKGDSLDSAKHHQRQERSVEQAQGERKIKKLPTTYYRKVITKKHNI